MLGVVASGIASGLSSLAIPLGAGARAQPSRHPDDSVLDVVVIGAGIAGLATAWALRDYHVAVLESSAFSGGRTASGQWQGWQYPLGAVAVDHPDAAVKALADSLQIQPLAVPEPARVTVHDGTVYASRRDSLFRQGGEAAFARWQLAVGKAGEGFRRTPPGSHDSVPGGLDQITARRWLRDLALPGVYHDQLGVLTRRRFAASLDDVSALCLASVVASDGMSQTSAQWTVAGGLSALTDGLAVRLGSRLLLQRRVESVRRGAGNAPHTVTLRAADGALQMLRARAVVLAVPVPVALTIAGAALEPGLRALLRDIRYGSTVTAAVFSQGPMATAAFEIALPGGLSFVSLHNAAWPHAAGGAVSESQAGHVSILHAAPHSMTDHRMFAMDDEAVQLHILADLETVFPGAARHVTGWDLHRHQYAFPVLTPGASGRLAAIHAMMDDRMVLAGDGVSYPTFGAALQSGQDAADRVRRALG